jgi:hypothetical protein
MSPISPMKLRYMQFVTDIFYKNGKIQCQTKASDNIRSFKKKILKKYHLSKDLILTNKLLKPFSEYKKISNVDSRIYISLNFNGSVIQTGLKRTKSIINIHYDNYQFGEIYYNGWSLNSLNQYINLLVGETRRKIVVLIDANPIRNP